VRDAVACLACLPGHSYQIPGALLHNPGTHLITEETFTNVIMNRTTRQHLPGFTMEAAMRRKGQEKEGEISVG